MTGSEAAEYGPLGQWFESVRDHAERLVAIYAQVAAAYAAYAVEVFCALQDNRPLIELAEPQVVVPSDLLTMPQVLLPLVQLRAADDGRALLTRYNRDLTASHQRVADASASLRRDEPASILDDANRLAKRENANDLTEELPEALHDYAATVVMALGELIPPGQT